MVNSAWEVRVASTLGSAHHRTGTENQDSLLCSERDGWVLIAIADGHGSSRYVRSSTGSRVAVKVAIEMANAAVRDNRAHAVLAASEQIVASWRRQVAADLRERPFTGAEVERLGTDAASAPEVAYGSTLLLGVLGANEQFFLQLGDGDIVVHRADGSVEMPFAGEPQMATNQTSSLCQANAARLMRAARIGSDGSPPNLVMMCTDGYGNSFADPNWRSNTVRDFAQLVRDGGVKQIAANLPQWTAESAEAGGDDTTLAVAMRSGAFALPLSPATTDPRTRRKRTPLVAAIAASSISLAFMGGRLSVGDSTTAITDPASSVSETTTPVTTELPTSTTGTTELSVTSSTTSLPTEPTPPDDVVEVIAAGNGSTRSVIVRISADGTVAARLETHTFIVPLQTSFFDGSSLFVVANGVLHITRTDDSSSTPIRIGFEAASVAGSGGYLLVIDSQLTKYSVLGVDDGDLRPVGNGSLLETKE